MKKILLALSLMLGMTGLTFAQTKKAEKAKTAATKPAAKPSTAAAPTKKDGTPDMRYKANKEKAKTVAGPTKKDGTPDMRYKANKEKAKPAAKKKG
ncbi:MAG: hypothetical protein KGO92_01900 [Bacteroidota bacterium]|nr:hypothetical protein [Bacteroidota bacterium]